MHVRVSEILGNLLRICFKSFGRLCRKDTGYSRHLTPRARELCSGRSRFESWMGHLSLTPALSWFHQSLQENVVVVRLDYTMSFQILTRVISPHLTPYSLATGNVVKYPTSPSLLCANVLSTCFRRIRVHNIRVFARAPSLAA